MAATLHRASSACAGEGQFASAPGEGRLTAGLSRKKILMGGQHVPSLGKSYPPVHLPFPLTRLSFGAEFDARLHSLLQQPRKRYDCTHPNNCKNVAHHRWHSSTPRHTRLKSVISMSSGSQSFRTPRTAYRDRQTPSSSGASGMSLARIPDTITTLGPRKDVRTVHANPVVPALSGKVNEYRDVEMCGGTWRVPLDLRFRGRRRFDSRVARRSVASASTTSG